VRRTLLVALLVVSTLSLAGAGAPAAGAVAQDDCEFPVTVTDATGAEVTVDAEPGSVVTLAPSAAQTMWEIGAEEKVVGVSQYATYLDGAEGLTNVSGEGRSFVNREVVVGLEPDLVLAPDVIENDTVTALRDAGLTVYRFDRAESMDDVVEKTRLTGRLVGECGAADARADRLQADLATVEEAVAGEDRPTAMYVLGGGDFVFTAASGTFIGGMIQTAGATNLPAEENLSGYAQLNDEFVASVDPDYLIVNDRDGVPGSGVYQNLTAVQEGRVVELQVNYLNQPAPRTIVPIRQMAQAFHPEAYAAANATATPTETPTEMTPSESPTEVTPSESPTETTPSETPVGSPGLGLTGALAALAAAALLAVRRRP